MDSIAQYLNPLLLNDRLQVSINGPEQATFWIGVLQILLIDVLLSGDNAVVIAMACRGLAPRQRVWGMALGITLAVALRIIFAAILTQLIQLAYLKLVGGLTLLYIAAKLLVPVQAGKDEINAAAGLWGAVWIVVVADVIMSLDNIFPVAAVARGNLALLAIGLAGTIPLLLIGAALVTAVLDRFPILVWAGAALLGWIAGEMMTTDPVVSDYLMPKLGEALAGQIQTAAAVVGAILVLAVGGIWRRARRSGAVR